MKLGLRVLLRVKRLTFHNSGKREDYAQCKNIDISQLWRGRVPYLIPFPLEVAIYLNLIQSKCYIFSNFRFFDGVWFRIFALCKRYDILQLCLGRGKGSGAAGGKRLTVQHRFFLIRYCDIWSDLIASDLLMSSDLWSVDIWWLCRLCRVQGNTDFTSSDTPWHLITSDDIWSVDVIWHMISWHLITSYQILWPLIASDQLEASGRLCRVQGQHRFYLIRYYHIWWHLTRYCGIWSDTRTSDQIRWHLISWYQLTYDQLTSDHTTSVVMTSGQLISDDIGSVDQLIRNQRKQNLNWLGSSWLYKDL